MYVTTEFWPADKHDAKSKTKQILGLSLFRDQKPLQDERNNLHNCASIFPLEGASDLLSTALEDVENQPLLLSLPTDRSSINLTSLSIGYQPLIERISKKLTTT
jgi:hypothetical protein